VILMKEVYYPETGENGEGKPTLVFDWIHALYWNLQRMFLTRSDAFVGADIPIFVDRNNLDARLQPGVFVARNRPKGHRRGYRVWEEASRFPDVVILVITNRWRLSHLLTTIGEYDRYGVRELYLLNPYTPMYVDGWQRNGESLKPISTADRDDFTSPTLGVRSATNDGYVEFFGPDGLLWESTMEMSLSQPLGIPH